MHKVFVRHPAFFILLHCLVWWITTILAKSTLDGYGDMVEVYAWSQHWLMGSDKHPQFLPWMAKLWFTVARQTVASFYFLSAINLAVAMFGILALGRAVKLGDMQLAVALALCALALPYLTLPGKLNMNAICLSTWPWTAWAFVRTIDRAARRRLVHAVLLGILAAVSMLGKYYSVVLLLPLFLYTLAPGQRWIWRTPAPWLAGAAFLLAFLPHLLWLIEHSDAVAYANNQDSGGGMANRFRYILKFAAAPLVYWPIPIVFAVVALSSGRYPGRIGKALDFRTVPGVLAVAAIGPWLTPIAFSIVGLAELSTPWAIPIGFAFTLYLVANSDPDRLAVNGPRLLDAYRFIWPAMIVTGLAIAVGAGMKSDARSYRPEAESAGAVHEYWAARHAAPLLWAARGNSAAVLAFFSPTALEALPKLPDRLPSYYPPFADWKDKAGVVFCSLRRGEDVDEACLNEMVAWADAAGLQAEPVTLTVRRGGWRFPKDVPFALAVVYVWPR